MLLSWNAAFAANLAGSAKVYDWTGFIVSYIPITGVIDLDNKLLVVDDFSFFGINWQTTNVELLDPGTYTRTHNGVTITATINPGEIGAYMVIVWGSSEFPTFMAWQPSQGNTVFTSVDIDGDGVPGMVLPYGPFNGFSAVYDFTAEPQGPGVTIDILVEGGTVQECSGPGGALVNFTAQTQLFGNAVLNRIDWIVDSAAAGSGMTLSKQLSLGSHTVETVATTTTGESGSDSVDVEVKDTTGPTVEIAFIDHNGQEVTSAPRGSVQIKLTATDNCDEAPTVSGAAAPVMNVMDGDMIRINGTQDDIRIPTSAVEIRATGRDASGNFGSAMKTLLIE